MTFNIVHQERHTKARAGLLSTDHGVIPTPIFMPVGTLGTVKGVHQRELSDDLEAPIILSNTYHLYLRPGMEVLSQAGGLHAFMGWDLPILTDSGGYQVYSLAQRRTISEEGVVFHDHLQGSRHLFTPERAIDLQRTIGADIIMAFDECTPAPCTYDYAKTSMALTHRWLARCCERFASTEALYGHRQVLFPIVQGSVYKDLRQKSAEAIASVDCAGHGIGGVCHPTGQLYEVTGWVCDVLPKEKPRYLMGVGTPQDIIECIACGVDMFDCVMPARNGRNGMLFTTEGTINIKNSKWKYEFKSLDPVLGGYVSTHYTKAYLHHLIRANERLGAQVATLQNLGFYLWLVREARKHILEDRFEEWKDEVLPRLMRRI
ncbi:MAG: tRNA guanosine(34) transglycosylase Tgt [Bacteroidota bacterium]